jgi:hypothetical protein
MVASPLAVENDLLILTYQSSQRSGDERRSSSSDERLNTVSEFTRNILFLIQQLGKPSHMDLEETKLTLDALCGKLSGRGFPDADQRRLFDALNEAHRLASENAASTGKRSAPDHSNVERRPAHTVLPPPHLGEHPMEAYYVIIKSSVRHLVSTLDEKYSEQLQQCGF